MTLNTKNVIWILAGILFALASIWIHYLVKVEMAPGGHASTGELGDLQVGGESPDFSGTDLQGRQVALSEFRDRKVVVLDFWATWCGPCLMAMPALQELSDEFGAHDVEVLAVNIRENPERVRDFIERKGYTFRVVMDRDGAIGDRFGVTAIPVLVVVGADGRVEWIKLGYSPKNDDGLRELLVRLRAESQSVGSATM